MPLLCPKPSGDAIHALALALDRHLLRTFDRQRIRLLAGLETCSQRTMTSIDRIPGHPLGGQTRVQGTPQHACSQLRFGGKDHLFWHICFSTALGVLRPTLGQIQLSIHKRMARLAGIRQKDPDLAVFDASCRPTVLSLHPHRLLPFLQKARFIQDVDPIRISKHLADIGLQLITHLVALPHRSV